MTDDILQNVVKGFNGTILAYGQTGTGKTHTIVRDILPQTVSFFTKYIEKPNCNLYFSAAQIYNEQISDLVDSLRELEIRNNKDCFYIDNLAEQEITNINDLNHFIDITEGNRKKGVTSLNEFSSRSHAIYTFKLVQREKHMTSILNLVDLAGSERTDKSKIKSEQKTESISINKSLTALCRCIVFLKERKSHVPYRDSKLTKLLMNSISGNSKTCLIVTLSPSIDDYEETISSLNFAQNACKVKLNPKINDKSRGANKEYLDSLAKELVEKDRIIAELREENYQLNQVNQDYSENIGSKLTRPSDDKQNAGKRESQFVKEERECVVNE